VPTSAKGRVNGAVRITYPSAALDTRVRRVWGALALLCLGVLAAAALVGFALARSIVRPVRRLEQATAQFAAGDLSVRVDDTAGAPELRHLAATFNRMAERLALLLHSQERFVADASHQLRTPLTALRLRLENLEARLPQEDQTDVEAASSEVARMSRLVDGLLLLAREDGDGHAREPVDVAEVARDRSAVWTDVASERDVALTVTAPASAWALTVPGAVEQLVDNLLDNALIATPVGAPIDIRVERTADTIRLHVMDRGPGMDAVSRARAFDRFWRAPGAESGGSGLGLPIVRQLAEASGGGARLDDREGGGVDAVVVLPAATTPADTAAPDEPAFLAGR
jgi:signal transduction histidine kinase